MQHTERTNWKSATSLIPRSVRCARFVTGPSWRSAARSYFVVLQGLPGYCVRHVGAIGGCGLDPEHTGQESNTVASEGLSTCCGLWGLLGLRGAGLAVARRPVHGVGGRGLPHRARRIAQHHRTTTVRCTRLGFLSGSHHTSASTGRTTSHG
jgi:hypothetical protein